MAVRGRSKVVVTVQYGKFREVLPSNILVSCMQDDKIEYNDFECDV